MKKLQQKSLVKITHNGDCVEKRSEPCKNNYRDNLIFLSKNINIDIMNIIK